MHLPHALSMDPKIEIRNVMERQRGARITMMDEMIAGMYFTCQSSPHDLLTRFTDTIIHSNFL